MKLFIFSLFSFFVIQSAYSQNNIEINYTRKNNNQIEFHYQKRVPGSYYLTLEFTQLENCSNNRIIYKLLTHQSGTLLTLTPKNPEKGISFSYNFRYILGNPNPKIKENITYALPFNTGKSVKVFEASNVGEKYFGDEKPINWKSFVVYTKIPDTIRAIRKGIVIKIISEFTNDESIKKVYTSKRNRILIEHQDGTYSSYSGFNKNRIFVKLGQRIYPHTALGVLEKFNTDYRLDFCVYHYLKNLLDNKKSTLTNQNRKQKFINPNFFVNNEVKKIEHGKTYSVAFNEEVKLQEFSKREKKKYKKKPENFK